MFRTRYERYFFFALYRKLAESVSFCVRKVHFPYTWNFPALVRENQLSARKTTPTRLTFGARWTKSFICMSLISGGSIVARKSLENLINYHFKMLITITVDSMQFFPILILKNLRIWSFLKIFKGENEPLFLKSGSFLKSKLGKNCIELWPTVIVTRKAIFHILKFLPVNASIFH